MKHSHLELAQVQAHTLFVYDANGHLLSLNEPEPDDPAPRFFLSRTKDGNFWSTGHDLPDAVSEELDHLASTEPLLGEIGATPIHCGRYTQLLERHKPIIETYHGPAYLLPALEPPTGTTTISKINRNLLLPHFPYTHSMLADRSPVVVVVEADAAVAACYSVRSSDLAIEAGVDTIEGYRGRGYAVEAVCGWATGVRALGKIPLYSTSWDNQASQAVARKLGAVMYADNFHIT